MVTATLSDGVTTIVFDGFQVVSNRFEAENFNPLSFPENEGIEVIFLGQFFDVYNIDWTLKDDPTWPISGESAAEKKLALKALIRANEINDYLLTLTFDSEDSTTASPNLEVYTGKVKLSKYRSEAGTNTVVLKGDFEFWLSDA